MYYSVLIHNNKPYKKVDFHSINPLRIKNKTQYLKKAFEWELYSYQKIILKDTILLNSNFLAVITDKGVKILYTKVNNVNYLYKYIQSEYPGVYKNIKQNIQELLDSDNDIILTNNCGKELFLNPTFPKFKTISDRNEFFKENLEGYYNDKKDVKSVDEYLPKKVVTIDDVFDELTF